LAQSFCPNPSAPPQNHRFAQNEIADGAKLVVVHGAAADADRVDRDPDILRPDCLRQLDLAARRLSDAFQNQGLHRLLSCLDGGEQTAYDPATQAAGPVRWADARHCRIAASQRNRAWSAADKALRP